MNANQLKALYPNASPAFIRLNSDNSGQVGVLADSPGQAPVVERHTGNGAMGAVRVQGGISGRFLVRVTSFRRHLLDEDNLCEKYHVDLCRYAGVIPTDKAGRAKIEVCQQKVGSKEPEETKIEVYEIQGG